MIGFLIFVGSIALIFYAKWSIKRADEQARAEYERSPEAQRERERLERKS